jgi:Ca2+-dependent lipid-binding protein
MAINLMTETFNPLKSEIFYTKACLLLSSHALNLQCIKYVSNHCLFRLELINYISNSQYLSLSFLMRLKLLSRSTTLFYGKVKIILLFVVTQIFTFIFAYFKKNIYIFSINLVIFFIFIIFINFCVLKSNHKKYKKNNKKPQLELDWTNNS